MFSYVVNQIAQRISIPSCVYLINLSLFGTIMPTLNCFSNSIYIDTMACRSRWTRRSCCNSTKGTCQEELITCILCNISHLWVWIFWLGARVSYVNVVFNYLKRWMDNNIQNKNNSRPCNVCDYWKRSIVPNKKW